MRICFDGTTVGEIPLEDQIRAAAAAGFRCLDLGVSALEAYVAIYPTVLLDALLREHHVYIAALGGMGSLTFDPHGGFTMTQARILEVCTHLDVLGGGMLTVRPGERSDISAQAATAQIVHALRRLSDLVAPFDVQLACEFSGGEPCALRSLSHSQEIVERVSRSNVGLALHAAALVGVPNVSHELDAVDVSKLCLVRLGDLSEPSSALPDRRTICSRLAEKGYRGPYSVQPAQPFTALEAKAGLTLNAATERLSALVP
jgi:xylose isomerase-like TIM barrel protein